MADKAVTFGASAPFGTVAGWEYQNTSGAVNLDRAAALDELGNEVASATFNNRTETTATLMCNNNTNTVPAAIGALLGSGDGIILTRIALGTSASAYATMTLTGHQHGANKHANTLKNVAHAIALAKAFGATDFMGGTAGTNATAIASSCEISCEHADENDADGGHFAGENHTPRITASTTWLGVPSAAATTGWDVTVTTTTDENTGLQKTVVNGTKKLAFS